MKTVKIAVESEVSIDINENEDVTVLYQNEPLITEYSFTYIEEFKLNEDDLINESELIEKTKEKCTDILISNNSLAYLKGLDFTINLDKITTQIVQ